MDIVKIDKNSTFEKTFQQLSIILKEADLPKLNYENISIRCSRILDNAALITVESICLTSTSNSMLNCSCDKLKTATKYNISLFTNKNRWVSRELVMDDQYTGSNYKFSYFKII